LDRSVGRIGPNSNSIGESCAFDPSRQVQWVACIWHGISISYYDAPYAIGTFRPAGETHMESTSQHPPVPGVGKAPKPRRILAIGFVAILFAATLGAFIFAIMLVQRFDGEPSSAADDAFDIDKEIDQKDWLIIQRRQLLRCYIQELDQQAESIWKDIDALQSEIDAYQKQFKELEVSEEGRRLIKDKWAVRYFVDKWGEPLPDETVAKHCRVRLNVLMFTVRRSLKKEGAAYTISPETQRKVNMIEFHVSEAKKKYIRHRRLLSALAASVAPGGPVTPGTLKEAVEKMRSEFTLEDWGHPSAQPQPGAKGSTRVQSKDDSPTQKEQEPESLDSSTLLHDVESSQSGVRSNSGDTTLSRDAVRVRDEPRRRSLPE
jgi:hypothetical protein